MSNFAEQDEAINDNDDGRPGLVQIKLNNAKRDQKLVAAESRSSCLPPPSKHPHPSAQYDRTGHSQAVARSTTDGYDFGSRSKTITDSADRHLLQKECQREQRDDGDATSPQVVPIKSH